MLLSELKKGQKATIKALLDSKDSSLLMEMGCLPGEEIEMIAEAPLGDPITVRITGYRLSLRKNEARKVEVDPSN